ncbi:MAG: RES family NAD+ phosphorylase [Acidobacteriaceae bacterium]|nr:RES family NAD+ phosphorylase [Acidobacteriaceae bacterium]
MILWRISNHADLLGIGGLHTSARWHTEGKPVVYLAENPSSALLETLVHLELDESEWPDHYRLLKVEVDDGTPFEEVALSSLPALWKNNEVWTRTRGDAWIKANATALLRVPSVITPETWNWLLNPRHQDAARVRIIASTTHSYELRLF